MSACMHSDMWFLTVELACFLLHTEQVKSDIKQSYLSETKRQRAVLADYSIIRTSLILRAPNTKCPDNRGSTCTVIF